MTQQQRRTTKLKKFCKCGHLKTMHLENGSCLVYITREIPTQPTNDDFINAVKRCHGLLWSIRVESCARSIISCCLFANLK
jgi:hypothetical protein